MKNAFFYLLFAAILLTLISCGEKKTDSPSEKLTFWHFWSEPTQSKALDDIIAKFEKEYGVEVETTELSWNDGKTKLFAAFNSGKAPDVLELGSDWTAQFSAAGVLAELGDEQVLSEFVDFSKAPAIWNGKPIAKPWVVDTRVLFYNKDLLSKADLGTDPPKTIEELKNMSEQINMLTDVYGYASNASDPHRLYKKILCFMFTRGGRVLDDEGKPVLYSPENLRAFYDYVDLSRMGIAETQKQLDAAFIKGKVGFWISGSWLLNRIENENPSLNYGAALIPGTSENEPGVSFAGGEYLAISEQSKNKELAAKFVDFMTSGENALLFCKAISDAGFPADKRYFNDPYFKTQGAKQVFAEQLKHARPTPVHPKWLDVEPILETAVVEAIYAKKSVEDALGDAQSKLENLLK